MNYREELFKALTAGVDGVFRDKSIEALVEVCRATRKEGYDAGFRDGTEMKAEAQQSLYESGANDTWECVRKLSSEISGETIKSIFDAPYCEVFKRFTASEAMAKVKEYEEKQKEPAFKIGDRVRTTGERDRHGVELFPAGTIGEVMEVDCDGDCLVMPYETYRAPYYYPTDALELANDVIVVGDEVWLLDENYHGVVTAVWEDCGVVKTERLTQSGKLACDDVKDLHRTGRRFPEIVNILKQMQEGDE